MPRVKLRIALLLLALAPFVRSEEEDERARVVFHFTELKPGGSAEAALKVYNEWVANGADPGRLPSAMEAMYEAAGGGAKSFKKVAHLIAKGLKPEEVSDKSLRHLQVDEAHSRQMAAIREANIESVLADILKSRKGEWKIGRSDSGNPDSGMKSDLDQTLYVLKKGPHGQWVRDLDADRELIREFERRWKEKFPNLSLDALDIASIEGKQRFPDPRDTHLDFEGKFLETIDTLRRTPGAYTYPGAVVQQMQFRALLAVLQGTERSFMEYELGDDGEMRKLPFDEDYAQRVLFGISPALMPGHAYGAAVANYLELQKYMTAEKFETKYHLRVWDDCGQILALVDGRLKRGKDEYLDLPPEERARRNKEIVDPMFSDPVKRKLHKMALDVSADLRLIHKGGDKNLKKVFGDDVPKPEGYDARVFDKLAREMFGDKVEGAPTEKQIKAAVSEHRRLASEFCLESVYRSSVEAFKAYRDVRFQRPLSVEGYRHLMRGIDDADWPKTRKNLEFMSRMTFLYSLYDLGWYKSGKLLLRLRDQFKDVGLVEIGELWARGRVQNLVAPLRNAKLRQAMLGDLHRKLSLEVDLDDFTARGMKRNLGRLNERVQRRILAELGFRNVEGAEKVGHLLRLKKLSWSPAQFVKNAVWDPGSLDALAQIVRAYVTSEGDMERVKAVALDELIFAVPVAGQIYSLSKGGVQGLVLMAGAIQFPPFGIVLVVYSIGEAGYAIYDVEYAKHARNNVVDALYRGFSGPATRAYDKAPPQFTKDDAHRLKVLSTRLARAKEAKSEAEAKELAPRVARLRHKEQAWKDFRDGSWAGGYFTEWGAQKEQKPILVSLLQDVPPIISFSPMGIIDFRAEFDPRRDPARIAELKAVLDETKDANAYLDAAHELDELILLKDRYERARRYLEAAVGKDRTGMTEKEKRQGVPELLFKLRRDSLYPALKERAIRLKDERGNLSTPNPDTFVDDWVKAVGDWAVRELNDKGVMSGGDVGDIPVQELKDRLYEDYMRSKHLYEQFQEREKNRKEVAKIRLERRREMYRAAATGLAVEGFDLSRMAAALRLAAVRRNAPSIDADVLVVRKKGGDVLDDKAEVTVRVRVKADPHLYQGPYSWTLHRLDRAAAGAAIASGKLDPDIPLTAASKARLEKLLSASGDAEVMIPVVSVFCAKMPDLSKALAPTVEHLPRTRTGKGVFMGQTVPVGKPETVEEKKEEEPEEPAPAGPARIMMGLPQPATREQRLVGRVPYEWEKPSEATCTFLNPRSFNKKAKEAYPYVWIEWPEAPKREDKKRLIYEMRVHGGIPHMDLQTNRRPAGQLAADRFGWDVTGERREPGKKFTIRVPLGSSFYSAGDFTVEGRLMAFDYKKKYRDPSVEPDLELRFRLNLRYYPPELKTSGTSRLGPTGHAMGSIKIENAQHGRRVARIQAGGTTWHEWFAGSTSFRSPQAGSAPTSARVTFRNFGEDVTVDVPLKVQKPAKRAEPQLDYLERYLAEIERLEQIEDGADRYMARIVEHRGKCAFLFARGSDTVDVAQWLEYTDLYLEALTAYHARIGSADPKWKGWTGAWKYKHQSRNKVLKEGRWGEAVTWMQSRLAAYAAQECTRACRVGYAVGRRDLVQRFAGETEKWAKRVAIEEWREEAFKNVGRCHDKLGDLVFHQTGDLDAANAHFATAHAWFERAASEAGKKLARKPRKLEPDPRFERSAK